MDVLQMLLSFLPTHWPKDWKGSYQVADHGPSIPIDQVTSAKHDLVGTQPSVEFDFSTGGANHTIRAIVSDKHGDATIVLEGVQKLDHPVRNVGTALHFPLSTTAIVHFIFNESGQRHNYRFEGKIS